MEKLGLGKTSQFIIVLKKIRIFANIYFSYNNEDSTDCLYYFSIKKERKIKVESFFPKIQCLVTYAADYFIFRIFHVRKSGAT